MQKSKKSGKRLDKHQTDCNGLSNRINKVSKTIKELRPSTKDIDNIAETYRNKLLEIDRELEQESIDFWDGKFELRNAIVFSLKEKLGIGLSNILHVAVQVSSIKSDEEMSRSTKKRRGRYINKAIFNLHEANISIENYDIRKNINETLLTYFLNSEYKNNFFQIYLKMKENIETLGIEEFCIDSEIKEILEYRESKKTNYKKDELLKELYPELVNIEEEQQSTETRVRTL